MKKMLSLVGVAAVAALVMACGGDDTDPVPPNGDGDGDGDGTGGGDGDGVSRESTFVTGGLGEAGDWSGYLWTAASEAGENGGPAQGSTITPENFDGMSEICVTGNTGPTYEDWAMVGWNINQPIDEETFEGLDPPLDIDVSGTAGVNVKVLDNNATGLRVQIQTMAGESWCSDVPTGGEGVIPWGSFVKECWEGGANAPAYEPTTPIGQIMVQAPSRSNTAPTVFDYCVITLGPA